MGAPLTVGQIVHYVLSSHDALAVNRRRASAVGHHEDWPAGAQAHVGNPMSAGEIVPALVVWPHATGSFNGQAFLDGNDSLWLTSVPYDKDQDVPAGPMPPYKPGTWHWPPRA